MSLRLPVVRTVIVRIRSCAERCRSYRAGRSDRAAYDAPLQRRQARNRSRNGKRSGKRDGTRNCKRDGERDGTSALAATGVVLIPIAAPVEQRPEQP